MPFDYNTNIPMGTQRPSQSAPQFLTNFNSIFDIVAVNHVGFSDADGGKHWLLTMVNNAATPANPAATEINVYNKVPAGGADKVTLAGQQHLFLQRSTANSQFPFTATNTTGASQQGWTFLPSGILIKWGRDNANGNTTVVLPTGAGIPVFTSVYNTMVSVYHVTNPGTDANMSVYVNSFNTTSLSVYGGSRTSTGAKNIAFSWIMIGSGV